MHNQNTNTPLENFLHEIGNTLFLNETSFYDFYFSHYADISDALKKQIIDNLNSLPEIKFDVYIRYVKDEINKYHCYDPNACIIEKWMTKFNINEDDFPFNLNEEVIRLLSIKKVDYPLEIKEAREISLMQLEFHWYAIYIEVKNILSFIDGLITSNKKDYKDEIWFKVGLLFANGEMEKFITEYKSNCTQIAIKLGNEKGYRPYISESIGTNYKTSKKSIFSNKFKIDKILLYCKENNIVVTPNFSSRLSPE